MLTNLNFLIDQVGKDKGISREVIIETLEEAMLKAAQKKYGAEDDIEAHYNDDTGEVELFQFKTVVDEVEDPTTEISLGEAIALDPDVEEGDSIGVKIENTDFGRIAAQVAKQVIIQRVRAAEREYIYNEYKDRKDDLIAGTVRRVEHGNIIVDLGRTEAILLSKEQSPRETYRSHDRIVAYVVDVNKSTKGPQIVLSRTDTGLIHKLFEMEVPEIAEGIVQIVSAAREPGNRSKIAVVSRDTDVDPIGACVGMKGTRVQNIVQELRGEKIDIVTYSQDPVRYVCNALAPAQVSQVVIDEDERLMEVTVPDDQLSLAIGKRGQNVRLASQLTGWRIDIQSESKVEKMAEEARNLFQLLDNVDEDMAETLTRLGFLSIEDISRADINDLRIIPGLDEEKAEVMVHQAEKLWKEKREEENEKAPASREENKSEAPAKEADKPRPAAASSDDRPELMRLKSMDDDLMHRLQEAGYYTATDIVEAGLDPREFSEKFEIGARRARGILHSAKMRVKPSSEFSEDEKKTIIELSSPDGETKPESDALAAANAAFNDLSTPLADSGNTDDEEMDEDAEGDEKTEE